MLFLKSAAVAAPHYWKICRGHAKLHKLSIPPTIYLQRLVSSDSFEFIGAAEIGLYIYLSIADPCKYIKVRSQAVQD